MPMFEINEIDLTPYFDHPTRNPVSLDGGRMAFKIPKHFRCKSRKRFVKLLMGCGIPRNKAQIIADTPWPYLTWEQKWQMLRFCYLMRLEADTDA